MVGETRKLAIDRSDFITAFGRDADYHHMGPEFTYLDRRTGDLIWLYEDDEDFYM